MVAAPKSFHLSEHEGKKIITGSAVAARGRAMLFIGASGTGKSELALTLMAYGASLIGDDGVTLEETAAGLVLAPPPNISGKIEARGIGILAAPVTSAPLCAVVDLDTPETERLPPERHFLFSGKDVPLIHKVESPYFAVGLWQYLYHGRLL